MPFNGTICSSSPINAWFSRPHSPCAVFSFVSFFQDFQAVRCQAPCSLHSRFMAESIEDSSSSTDETLMDEDEVNKFSSILDQFTPVIPETVTQYYLKQSGVQTDDDRVVKLISASVQKFMSGKANRAKRTSLVSRPRRYHQRLLPTEQAAREVEQPSWCCRCGSTDGRYCHVRSIDERRTTWQEASRHDEQHARTE
jgi:hypothetical protein